MPQIIRITDETTAEELRGEIAKRNAQAKRVSIMHPDYPGLHEVLNVLITELEARGRCPE